MKKLLLLDHEPWTIRRKQLFYDLFKEAGFPLEVWDLSQWLYPGISNPDGLNDEEYLTKIHSYSQYKEKLNTLNASETIIIAEIFPFKWKNRLVFKSLSLHKMEIMKIELYGNTTLKESTYHRLKKLTLAQYPKAICNKLFNMILQLYNKFNDIDAPKYLLSSNSTLPLTHHINHPDYEEYMFKEHNRLVEGEYIVFCDIYFPFHTDLKFLYGVKKLPDAKKYQIQINRYFDALETKYKMPVVIAAHPKANYKGNEFGHRKIFKYHTSDLVYFASAVTMHLCNTISYVILGNKPIAFISTDDYGATAKNRQRLELLANETLEQPIYNIDRVPLSEIEFNKVDDDIRYKYIYNYLTSKETENKRNQDIIIELRDII